MIDANDFPYEIQYAMQLKSIKVPRFIIIITILCFSFDLKSIFFSVWCTTSHFSKQWVFFEGALRVGFHHKNSSFRYDNRWQRTLSFIESVIVFDIIIALCLD